MGSKLNPGKFDCYTNALPDEPMFVLLARDPFAPELVRMWARTAELSNRRSSERMGFSGPVETVGPEKIAEAMDCAEQMKRWREANPKPVGGYPRAIAGEDWADVSYLMAVIDSAIEDGYDPDEDGPLLDEIRETVKAFSAKKYAGEPVAYMRDAQPEAEDAAYVPCAKGDPGAFAVYR